MPYILTKTNGQQIAVVQDGSINANTADLTFVGKNYSGYGQVVNENFLQLLENFANTTGPSNPVIGELWYDTANKKLNVNTDGSTYGWKKLALINNTQTGFPNDQTLGDFFWDSSLQKLYVYNGSQYVLIGPSGAGSSLTSGAVVGSITSDAGLKNSVLLQQINGDVPALVADASFITNSQDGLFAKFPAVGAGLTIQGTNSLGISTQFLLWGTASTAQGLVRASENYSTVHSGDAFLLKTELAGFSGTVNIQSDDGIYIGGNRIIHLHVTGNTVGNLSNINASRINFNVTENSTLTEIFHIDGGGSTQAILPNASKATNIGATGSGNSFNKTYSTNLISATLTAPGATEPTSTPASGNGVITGNWTVNGNFTVANGASIAATTAGLATNANNLQNSDNSGYIHTAINGSANTVVQLDSTGYAHVQGLTGTNNPQLNGAWTLGSGATLQASTLKGVGSTGFVGLDTSGSNNSVVQRDAAGGITGVTLYGASLQAPTIRAATDPGATGIIYGQWQMGSGANMQATSLAGTGGFFAATTSNQPNSIAQRDSSGILAATATQAEYADLAENYSSDSDYEPGTVLVIGGVKETTQCSARASVNWAGIVSTNPAHLMNSTIDGVAVALSGRVPCKVVGPITKGDLMVTSSVLGHAEAYKEGDNTLAVIGRALEDAPPGPGVIEVKV